MRNLQSRRSTLPMRACAAAVLGACMALLGVAASLEADPAGLGTHTQLDLPACQWRVDHGYACPTCGMTTAFALAADGRLIAAARTQPAGALGAMIVAMAAWAAGYVLVTGCDARRWLRGLWRPATGAAAILVVLAAWGYGVIVGA